MNPNNLQAWSEDKTKQKGVDFVNLYREHSNMPQFAPMNAASLLALEDSFLSSPAPGSALSRRSSGYFSQGESDNENFAAENGGDYTLNANNEFVCGTCQKGFLKLVGLRSHEVTHLEEKSELCRYCSKAFARRHDMFRHERTVHAQERLTTCLTCKNVFADPDSLVAHCQIENHTLPDAKPTSKKPKSKSLHKRTNSAVKKSSSSYTATQLSVNQVQAQVFSHPQTYQGLGNQQPLTQQMQQMTLQQQQQQKMHMQQILHQQQQIQHAQQHTRTSSWQSSTQGMSLDINPNLFTQAPGNLGAGSDRGHPLSSSMTDAQSIFQRTEPQPSFQNTPFAFLDAPSVADPMPIPGYQMNQQQLHQPVPMSLNMNDLAGSTSGEFNPHSNQEGLHRRLSSQSSLPPLLNTGNSQAPSLFQNDFGFTAQMNFGIDSTMFQATSPGLGDRFMFEDRYDSAMDGLVIHNEEPQLESFMPLPRFDNI